MIPKNIKKEHILKAIDEVEKIGVTGSRISKKFRLEYNGRHYPPKYVISLANKYANGKELDSSEFSGGRESNDFLKYFGFNIRETQSSEKNIPKHPTENDKISHRKTTHDERCQQCKKSINLILKKIYGKVEPNYKFEIGTNPEDFRNTHYYNRLKEIYEALQAHRGFKDFVKVKTLPNCDFFVPKHGLIIEFDESQHFTLPRKITLEHYPEKLELGFDKERWIKLCEKKKAKDNDPPYRDEQRAWYDTLRDFLPLKKGLKPTIRLFAKDFEWCSLNPNNRSDVKIFENILKKTSPSWEIDVREEPDKEARKMKKKQASWGIEVREEPNPFLARVILAGEWESAEEGEWKVFSKEEAKRLLNDICEKWPKDKKVKFLITCGGFIQFDWPEEIDDNSVNRLVAEAKKCAKFILKDDLVKKLREFTDYITLGIDSNKNPNSTYSREPHIELVFLINLTNNRFYWTGKSYPTQEQENGLVRISNLKTHFINLKGESIMVLGCNDLTIFNPRSKNAKYWRKNVNTEFKNLAKNKKPIYVLQHPHTTVKTTTWRNAWSGVRKILPSVEQYAGAGRYYESDCNRSEWDALDNVLKKTKCGDTIDFIVKLLEE